LSDVTFNTAGVATDDILIYDGTEWINSPIIGDIAAILDDLNGE
jgi:hypothetical protein